LHCSLVTKKLSCTTTAHRTRFGSPDAFCYIHLIYAPEVPASHSMKSASPTPTNSPPCVCPAGQGKPWPRVGNPDTQVATPLFCAVMRPRCWSLRLPEGQEDVLPAAGAREVKTSNRPVPETFADGSALRSKWKLQVLPADSEGKSKVRRVVMSVVLPSLKILPFRVPRRTAPVHTSY
jgi:hypothetical protein